MTDYTKLVSSVAELNEEEVIIIVRELIAEGDDPLEIVHACQQGMRQVGERYSEGQYFIAGLIMAGEILKQVMELIGPAFQSCEHKETQAKIVLGTVQEDIHDLGKNIVKMLLTCHGFDVYDLGVNVPPERFVDETVKIQPDIIGLSGLITASYDSMKETIDLLRKETRDWPRQPHIIIGGSQIDEQISSLVGTDYWVTEADSGVMLCKKLLGE